MTKLISFCKANLLLAVIFVALAVGGFGVVPYCMGERTGMIEAPQLVAPAVRRHVNVEAEASRRISENNKRTILFLQQNETWHQARERQMFEIGVAMACRVLNDTNQLHLYADVTKAAWAELAELQSGTNHVRATNSASGTATAKNAGSAENQ